MSTQIKKYWESFRSSFWFTPTVMAAFSAAIAFGAVFLDRRLPDSWHAGGLGYGGGPEGARAVLSVIASSMITVAGVVFSITIVALTLASSQFGPRLLRNFMRDTSNQFVLGTFIATYLYCLLVMRTVRGLDDHQFVPHVAVTIGVLLGIASLGVLIYFIHHVAISIQASFIVGNVGEELRAAIDRLFPAELGKGKEEVEHVHDTTSRYQHGAAKARVSAQHSGYLQAIDNDGLLQLAREQDLVVRIGRRPGSFVIKGDELAHVKSSDQSNETIAQRVSEMFIIGRTRNSSQDVEFIVSQLVEVALRALSPGINDPFTAISCIDWLAAGLSEMAGRALPSERRCDSDGKVRIIAESVKFESLADLAFNQIRQAGQQHPAISIRLLYTIGSIAERTHRVADLDSLRSHTQLIWEGAWQESLQGSERVELERAYQRTLRIVTAGATL